MEHPLKPTYPSLPCYRELVEYYHAVNAFGYPRKDCLGTSTETPNSSD